MIALVGRNRGLAVLSVETALAGVATRQLSPLPCCSQIPVVPRNEVHIQTFLCRPPLVHHQRLLKEKCLRPRIPNILLDAFYQV